MRSRRATPLPARHCTASRKAFRAPLRGLMLGLLAAPVSAIVAEAPPPKPDAPQSAAAATAAEPAGNAPVFDIMNYQVDGNSVLDVEAVEMAVYPFLGPDKRIEDVEKARAALESAYRAKGYPTVAVDIPEQDVEGGVVRLQVVEGTVEYLNISGARYYSQGKIREGIPALAEGKVPHMPEVQEQMAALAKESPDRVVTPVFRAGSTPGKTEVEIKVKDELPLHGGLEINGRNTEYTTRTRLIASLRYDNLWDKFHSASLQYQVSPENSNEVEVWSGTYVLPTNWLDTRLALYGIGISSNTELGTVVGGTNVVGTGEIFGGRWIKPLPQRGDYMQSAVFGLDYKNFTQSTALAGEDTGKNPIDYMPLTLSYDGTLRTEAYTTYLNSALHYGIRGVGSSPAAFEERRAGAKPDFLYLTLDLKHQHVLPYDLLAVGRFGGQVSDQPLISNEQYAVGGMQSVRGYYQTQQLGDDGVNLSFELHSPMLIPEQFDYAQYLRALAFFDWGYLWIKDPLPGNPSFYQLAATGVGLRTQVLKHVIGELDWGYPFYAQGTVQPGNSRIDFRMVYEY